MKKKENIVIIVVLVLMLVAIIGVSYAAFRFIGVGSRINSITTGVITMSYTESENIIKLSGALPTTDTTGKQRLNAGEYFDFTVSSTISKNTNINYEISAKEEGKGSIDGSNIKLYLTRLTDSGEEELMSPSVYKEESDNNEYTGRPANEMSLYTSSMNSSEENRYRLRMWVSEEYNPQGDGGSLSFSVRINVYGKDGELKPVGENAVELVKSKANVEDLDYASATLGQQKEMWTHSHPATEQTEALTDYRYIGADPNNYVTFNDELWRIIGVFSIDDGTGKVEERLKIIKDESIGTVAFNVTNENNYSTTTLKVLLNEGDYYNQTNNYQEIGLSEEARSMIGNSKWYLGGASNFTSVDNGLVNHFYTYERGLDVYSGRETSWVGKVGLMYASDYGYATSGGTTTNRNACLNKELYNWNTVSDCYSNDWLYKADYYQWLLLPLAIDGHSFFSVYNTGRIGNGGSTNLIDVRPVVYLNSNIKIVSGSGSSNDPYQLSN